MVYWQVESRSRTRTGIRLPARVPCRQMSFPTVSAKFGDRNRTNGSSACPWRTVDLPLALAVEHQIAVFVTGGAARATPAAGWS
jgi:hypothetical protein